MAFSFRKLIKKPDPQSSGGNTVTLDVEAMVENLETLTAEHEQLKADYTSLQAEHATLSAALKAQETAHAAALEEKEKSVAARAAAQAIDIAAAQGVPADKLPKQSAEASGTAGRMADLQEQLNGEKDPAKRGKIAAEMRALRDKAN